MEKIVVLLPAYNEETAIGLTIDDVHHNLPEAEVVVINNCCTDETVWIAHKWGATVIDCPIPGKGNAVRKALAEVDADYYIMMDSDYTYPAQHLYDLVRLLRHRADVVVGYRQWGARGSIAKFNSLGNWGLTKIARLLYHYPVHDVCSGMWGFRRVAVEQFNLTSTGFTLEADLFINTIRSGLRFEQMPIEYRSRVYEDISKLRIGNGIEIAKFMLKDKFSVAYKPKPPEPANGGR